MTVRGAVEARLVSLAAERPDGPEPRLPTSFRPDAPVRAALLRRLFASPRVGLGTKAGSARRSAVGFRLDTRQRVIVKALVSRHCGARALRGAALAAHVRYLGRQGAGRSGEAAQFFDRSEDGVDPAERTAGWAENRHHFRFIISPEHGDRISDMVEYTRDVMARVSRDLDEPDLSWIAVCHFDTAQPHAHVLVSGRRADGRDLVIPRGYIAYGFRARAQEAAQERLGDLSRLDAERRIWRETQRNGFTAFDRRLLAAMDEHRRVEDAVGQRTAWAALMRGRLAHLEALGLAERQGRRFRLADDLKGRLHRLQSSGDVIRTLNQRRLSGRQIEVFRSDRVRGKVMKAGYHDELGAAPYLILTDQKNMEHYVRLGVGSPLPAVGSNVLVEAGPRGAARLSKVGLGLGQEPQPGRD
ncbi:DUF3363 domain-containing protein [Brevundimonas naejangsanensis]|nr:DUF3363 domain-containing protein [Brevundimonas naejangsanensis]